MNIKVDLMTMLLIGVLGIIIFKQFNRSVIIAPVTAEGGTKPTTCEGYADEGEKYPPCGIECGTGGNEADCLNCETLCEKKFMHMYPGATTATPEATEVAEGGEDEDEDNEDSDGGGGGDNNSGQNAQEYTKSTTPAQRDAANKKIENLPRPAAYAHSFNTILSRL